MYPPPSGPELTADECRALDDDYFSSDPFSYFRSKIDALLDWSDDVIEAPPELSENRRRFCELVGSAAEACYPTTQEARRTQVALDAIQLRHQTAEALLRLIHARLTCRSSADSRSLWMELTRTPSQLRALVEELRPEVESPGFFAVMAGLMIPLPNGTKLDKQAIAAVSNALLWVIRAAELVSSGPIDLNAANNKIKHGVSARPEAKLRITFTTQPPDEDGNVPIGALSGDSAFDVVDSIVLEYLSRPPKPHGSEPLGFERTLLRADASALLAEAWMLAILHGAIFNTSAYRHNGDSPHPHTPPHPGLALGPVPERVLGQHVVGLRFPVTTSMSGRVHRSPGMLYTDGSFQTLELGAPTRGTVVEG